MMTVDEAKKLLNDTDEFIKAKVLVSLMRRPKENLL